MYIQRFILSAILPLMIFAGHVQGQSPTLCRLGFTYDISHSPSWGKDKLVITRVYPYSSAEQAGLKVHDIIETIDGIPVDGEDLTGRLNPAGENEVMLTVTNLTDSAKQVSVKKDCKRTNAINEEQLATAFAMYSLETTSERLFVCPFTTTATADSAGYASYKTYSFAPVDENNRRLEETINACIEKEFKQKGLVYDTVAPDMLVQTYYFYKRNPNYRTQNTAATPSIPVYTYRYDCTLERMEKFPFLNPAAAETEAEYLLQLGIRLIDVRSKTGRILWECESNEMMSAPFRLDNYARKHIPLMCMQYPYVKYNRNAQFLISCKTYNYTGANYNINRLEQIVDIDPQSPAHLAGLRMHDIIEKIDRHSMNHTAEEYTAAYKQFILNTMSLRDPSTLFSDVNGFPYCMYWDKFKYAQVAEALQNPRSTAVFSYLYKYAPYVNPAGVNTCTFHVKRGKEKVAIVVHPSLHKETTLIVR
ncbi:MAG: DUF4136 domain-containing protein [Tannerellaceae bacterium]|nr:DUF4136 domain-containing protein [Tannerellaceae bacterium]